MKMKCFLASSSAVGSPPDPESITHQIHKPYSLCFKCIIKLPPLRILGKFQQRRMCAATAATAVSLSSAFVSHEGSNGGLKSISVAPWNSKQRQVRRASAGVISAKFDLKPPPYAFNALEPHMSKRTIELHWGEHHRAYVDNLNKQIAGTELDRKPLDEVVRITYNYGNRLPAFDNAAQAWNHAFFWESMRPRARGKPSRDLLAQIKKDFGSFDAFVYEFKTAAATQFGPGWTWLVYKTDHLKLGSALNPKLSDDGKKLAVVNTCDAMTPMVCYDSPLLAIDVWEHAYYLDYQNRRPDYIEAFVNELVSWDTVNTRYRTAKSAASRNQKLFRKMYVEYSRENARRVLWVFENLTQKLKSSRTDSKSESIATKGR